MPSPHAEVASLSPNTQGTRECQQTVPTHYIYPGPSALPYFSMTVHSASTLLQKPLKSNECSSRVHFLTGAPESHKANKLYAFLLLIRLTEHFRLRCQHEQKEASFFPDATKRLSLSHLWTILRDLFIYAADDGNHFPLVKL